ncbi:MAG: zymogen granule rane protein 16 [Hyphomicrobiales bacterium]|nr:zymogen granule rane protein 16 [Hyphomicrobiales bacterium]
MIMRSTTASGHLTSVRRHRRRNHAHVASGAILPAILLCGIAAAEAADCRPEDKILSVAREVGGGGGDPFDDRSYAASGEITKIEIWAGGYVDAIKVTYGESGFAPLHGGGGRNPGGSYSSLTLKPGDYITEITGGAGGYVDRLCFSVNGAAPSCYGGGGGDYFQISSAGRPLRSINGRSGGYLDRAGFSFGNRATIDVGSIQYDTAALDQALALAPAQIFSETLRNSSESTPIVNYSQQSQLTHTETISWNNETAESDTHSVGAKFTFGKKDVAQAEFSYQYQHSSSIKKSRGQSTTDSNSVTTGWSVSVPVAPGKTIRATTTWKNVNLDLPFTYNLIYRDDRGQEVCRQKQTGHLRGVSSFGLAHKFEPLTQ